MRKVINFIFAILNASFPFIAVGLIGILIYNELPNLLGIILCSVLFFGAVWLSIQIFKNIRRKGYITFTSKINENPELNEND